MQREHADWSPVGDRIAITMFMNTSPSELFTINTSGADLKQVTYGCDYAYDPEFSPGGNKIAFGSERSIWIVDADGDNLHTISDEAIPKGLSWSPDGERIAFVRGFKGSSNINNFGTIWIINKDGNNLQQLTQGVK